MLATAMREANTWLRRQVRMTPVSTLATRSQEASGQSSTELRLRCPTAHQCVDFTGVTCLTSPPCCKQRIVCRVRRSGGIGRRAAFRSQYPQGCASSSLASGIRKGCPVHGTAFSCILARFGSASSGPQSGWPDVVRQARGAIGSPERFVRTCPHRQDVLRGPNQCIGDGLLYAAA